MPTIPPAMQAKNVTENKIDKLISNSKLTVFSSGLNGHTPDYRIHNQHQRKALLSNFHLSGLLNGLCERNFHPSNSPTPAPALTPSVKNIKYRYFILLI